LSGGIKVDERYDTWHPIDNTNTFFYLADYTPDIEECHVLLLKVIDQAISDLKNFSDLSTQKRQEIWEEARGFLFDDDYCIDWDDRQLYFADIAALLGLDPHWLRGKIIKRLGKSIRRKKNGESKEVRRSCSHRAPHT
jgi:hypothetical protein